MSKGVIGNKEKIPIRDELVINKFGREAASCIFLEGDFHDILKLSQLVEIVDEILRQLNKIVKHDKFEFLYLEDDITTIDKLKMFSPKFKLITEEELDTFLENQTPNISNCDSYYKIAYECNKKYMLVEMPKWTILIRDILNS